MLNHLSVLVAEDQTFIALDLALAVEDAGGKVVGPAASCAEALSLLENGTVAAAILDFNLVDGESSPLVEALVSLDVPFIIHTAVDLPPSLAARFPNLVVRIKPCPAASLVAQLEILLVEHGHAVEGAARLHVISKRYEALKNEPPLLDEVPGFVDESLPELGA
ncbi:hypothetical protein [Brevundimonas sp. TWP2-3-4b2]|uniref:hypothetical protein n=1 Tax=Brevundimonas sp. TWP2-3-4b2 TaxID=2804595 RepID=UPI003CEB3E9B